MPACRDCAFSKLEKRLSPAQLTCHRLPPSPIVGRRGDGDFDPFVAWPPVQPDDWCAEFRVRSPLKRGVD